MAEQAVERFNQQPFMGRSLSVSEARPREEAPAGRRWRRVPAEWRLWRAASGRARRRRRLLRPASGRRIHAPAARRRRIPLGPWRADAPGREQLRAARKRKRGANDKRWEAKDRGPRGPIKERYTGRLGGLYDDPNDKSEPIEDFDDVASRAADEDKNES